MRTSISKLSAGAATVLALSALTTPAAAQQVGTIDGTNYPSSVQYLNTYAPHWQSLISDLADCDNLGLNEEPSGCTGSVRLLAAGDFRWSDVDGDPLAAGYDGETLNVMGGLAIDIGSSSQIGILGGYIENELNFTDFAIQRLDGFQIGAFVDAQAPIGIYGRATGAIAFLDGFGSRFLSVGAPSSVSANYEIEHYLLGAEIGYRLPIGSAALLTPYLSGGYSNVDQKQLDDSIFLIPEFSEDRFHATGGGKLNFDLGAFAAELKAGYRWNSGDDFVVLDGRNCAFDVCPTNLFSVDYGGDALVAGAGIGAQIGRLAAMASYEGEYGGGRDHHAARLTLKLPLGITPPPPPPPPPAPPPPPPCPDVVTCPDGTIINACDTCPPPPPAPPPPPPPAPEPERG